MKKAIIMAGICCFGTLGLGTSQADESGGMQAPTIETFLVNTFAEAEQMKSQYYNCARIAYYGGLYANKDPEGERLLNVSPYEDNPQLYAMFKELAEKHGYRHARFEAMSAECLASIGATRDNPIQLAAQ